MTSNDFTEEEINNKLKELDEEHEYEIQQKYKTGEIHDYSNIKNSNGKSKKKNKENPIITSEKEIEKNKIFNEISRLRQENTDLTCEEWSEVLKIKRQNLYNRIEEYFPDISLELDFILSIKNVLNIEDITLPFMGIVFAVPSSMKTQVIEILRKWIYSYFTDKFTSKSFVSHSATVAKEKLSEVDMLPRIKNKILLTPELSPLFTGKEEDIKEQFGIITRILDGKGLETESGVHGQRGYYGDYMFSWIGAAVDIPHYVYKFLSTIGFKIYFLRLPRIEISEDELVNQIISEKTFGEKIGEIEKLLLEYLIWFEICPISIGLQNIAKVEWDRNNDDKNAVRIIARLAMLLARLRGNVFVTKSSNTEDVIPSSSSLNNNNNKKENNNAPINYHATEFIHGLPTIENPSRANQQLYNLARGHALTLGRNHITIIDIPLIIKVVLSTGSIERVLILDLLIANNGTLTTSQITASMNISNSTAKRTMTEFKGLELVSMEKTDPNKSNSEYKITLNSKFDWFLNEEFQTLRDNFEPTDNQEFLKSKSNNDNDDSAAIKKPPVLGDPKQVESSKSNNREIINNINDSHRGENARSTFEEKQSKSLFNNPLISEDDLIDPNGYQYDPEVINNIDRFEFSDRWYCKNKNCKIRGDKWLLMRHNCKYKNNNNNND
jgi:hypothetical protein